MRRSAIVLLVAIIGLSLTSRAFARDFLEKTKWKVTVEPDADAQSAGARSFDDILTFKGNKLKSKALSKQGYKPGPYIENAPVGMAHYTAKLTDDKKDKADWSGTVTGDQMNGDLTITRADGTVANYTYRGSKEQ